MIKETVTLVDSGLFTELAIRIAREVEHVRATVPWYAEFPLINDRMVGSGLSEVEWIEDPYLDKIRDTTGVYVFPDIFRAGEQQTLKALGKAVWGSDTGDELETKRVWFRGLQEELGMPVPKTKIIKGYDALDQYLTDNSHHCFIKTTSKIRGSMETHEFWDSEQDEYWLTDLRLKLGGGREQVLFMVEEPVESKFETGLDTYSVGGKFPKTPLQGIEVKGKLILCSAQTKSDTPRPLDHALDLLSPQLEQRGYCNFLSAEFRGDILTDLCARAPNPGLGCEMEMISNIGEIIVAGAQGQLIEPVFEAEYGIQAAVFHEHPAELWKQFRIPDELRRWFKLMEFCRVGELYQIIPRLPHGEKIGWLIGIGNSIEEASEHLHKNVELLKNGPFDVRHDKLEEAVQQAIDMEAEGFGTFSNDPLPEPETVTSNGSE
jgi:hypothetical protein